MGRLFGSNCTQQEGWKLKSFDQRRVITGSVHEYADTVCSALSLCACVRCLMFILGLHIYFCKYGLMRTLVSQFGWRVLCLCHLRFMIAVFMLGPRSSTFGAFTAKVLQWK